MPDRRNNQKMMALGLRVGALRWRIKMDFVKNFTNSLALVLLGD